MPGKPRIGYGGAVYHVLNRGNYRQDLFTVSGSGSIYSISKAVVAETKQGNRRLKEWRKPGTPKSKACPFFFCRNGFSYQCPERIGDYFSNRRERQ